MKTYIRGKVHWAKLRWPEHPKADKEGRVRLALGTDKRLAETALADLILKRDASNNGIIPADTSWKSFRERYEVRIRTVSHSTRLAHLRALNEIERANPYIKEVRQFTPGSLDDLQTNLIESRVGQYMIVKIVKSIKSIMRRAEIWRLAPPQDWKEIKTGSLPRGRVDFYTHMELKRILNDFDGIWKTAVWLGGKAGLRPAEIWHLHEDAVSLHNRKIVIRPTECNFCIPKHHKPGLWVPKNGRSRTVEINDDLVQFLRWRKKNNRSPWFISEFSSWRPAYEGFTNTLGYKLRVALGRGFPYILRHTYATHEIQSGTDIKKVRDNMGHYSVVMTEVYTHLPKACDCAPPCAPLVPQGRT